MRIAQFKLIRAHRCIVVRARVVELRQCSVRSIKKGKNEAGEQPVVHGVNQNTILKKRIISSSNEKIVSRSGDSGAAVAIAKRESSWSPNGTTRISRTI